MRSSRSISTDGQGADDHPLIARIRAQLVRHVPVVGPTTDARAAAVAIVLRPDREDVHVLFIRRAEYALDPWSGQVAFPGGRHESGDASLVHTAYRETMEEIGVDLNGRAELLGTLDDMHSQTVRLPNVYVRPFVLAVSEIEPFDLSSEVAEAFWVPMSALFAVASWRTTSVTARGLTFDVNACHFEGQVIWGMTERILSHLLKLISDPS